MNGRWFGATGYASNKFFLWFPEREAIRKELEEEMQARLAATERELGYMKQSWEDKLKQSEVCWQLKGGGRT